MFFIKRWARAGSRTKAGASKVVLDTERREPPPSVAHFGAILRAAGQHDCAAREIRTFVVNDLHAKREVASALAHCGADTVVEAQGRRDSDSYAVINPPSIALASPVRHETPLIHAPSTASMIGGAEAAPSAEWGGASSKVGQSLCQGVGLRG